MANSCFLARVLPLCLAIALVGTAPLVAADAPRFLVRNANGTESRAPLTALDKLGGGAWLAIRQEGVALPALPSDEQIVLLSGDRIPALALRLDDEKLRFRHPDLNGNKDCVVPITSVAMIWRLAPDGTVNASKQRNQLLRAKRKRDRVLLRNGDILEGTLNALSAEQVEVEIARKNVVTKWLHVGAVLLSTELTEKAKPNENSARLVLSATDRSPGGRITVVGPSCDGTTFAARTTFGAVIRVPVERVVALDRVANHIVYLSDLPPRQYAFTPYLDETFAWSADANVLGRDLLLGGSTFDKGIGLHADSRITYALDKRFGRFDALVGLDDLDGREGIIRFRVLLDGKAVELGKTTWTCRDKGVWVSLNVAEVKEMTLIVESAGKGPIQGVVNVVEARLLRVGKAEVAP